MGLRDRARRLEQANSMNSDGPMVVPTSGMVRCVVAGSGDDGGWYDEAELITFPLLHDEQEEYRKLADEGRIGEHAFLMTDEDRTELGLDDDDCDEMHLLITLDPVPGTATLKRGGVVMYRDRLDVVELSSSEIKQLQKDERYFKKSVCGTMSDEN